MDVIGAGFGRTGTASLQKALHTLGFAPCYHWKTLLDEPAREAQWHQALADVEAGKPPRWESVYAGFNAAVDWPTAAFWRELAEFYPAAKVVLTVRDPEAWYASFAQTISVAMGTTQPSSDTRKAMTAHGIAGTPARDALARRIVAERVFHGRADDKEHVLAVYRRHVAEVVASVPTERLLLFDPADGWGPLTRFLGVAEPVEDYPHVNRRPDFWQLCVRT